MKNASWQEYASVIERHLIGLRGPDGLAPDVRNELMQIRDCLRKMELAFVGFKEAPAPVIQSYGKVQQNLAAARVTPPRAVKTTA